MSQFDVLQYFVCLLQFPGLLVITNHQMGFCTLWNSTDYQQQDHQIHISLSVVVLGCKVNPAGFTFCIISILLRKSEGAEWAGLTQYHSWCVEISSSKIPNLDQMEDCGYFKTALSEIPGATNTIASLVTECTL